MNANVFFSFLCILQTRILTSRFQVKVTHNSSTGFFIKLFDTVKYELIAQYLFMAALITDSSPKYRKICWTRRYLFVKITRDMVPLNTIRKIFLLNKRWQNSQQNHVLSNNQVIDLLVHKLWKWTDFYLFTETIPFSRKFRDHILSRFYHYIIPSATKGK